MNHQVTDFLKKQNFNSIIECIEFLTIVGFSLNESYNISCKIFDSRIQLETKGLRNEELFFVECLNGCEIKIDKNSKILNSIFYIKNNEIWFEQNFKKELFWCSYIKIWSVFEIKYQWNYQQIKPFIKDMLEKHLELGEVTPHKSAQIVDFELEKHLELGGGNTRSEVLHYFTSWKNISNWGGR